MDINEINIWKARINRAKSMQQKMHSIWKDSLDLYNCIFFEKIYGGLDPERVDVHFANWFINNTIPLVYFRDPYIFIKGRSERYFGFAETLETAINIFWKKLELKQQFKKVILSACLMPPGWLKVGYTAKIGQDIAKLDEIRQKTLIQNIKDSVTGIFKKEKEELTIEEQGILNEYIEEESIFATWLSSWNILMPEGYHQISQMPYLIEIEDIPKIDFLANPLYKNKNIAKETRSLSLDETGGKELRKPTYNRLSSGSVDDETAIIRLYHIWDRRTNKRLVISDEANEEHFSGNWSYDFQGFPYEPLIFDDTLPSQNESNPYPPNLILPILPQIIEQSQSRTQMVKWRKRASAIILAQKGLITEEDMRQIEKTEGVQLCLVSNIGAYQMTQVPNLPAGVFDVDRVIKEDLQMGTSMGQLMFQPMAGQRTATQARIGQSGLELKASARVDVVEDFTIKVAKKLCLLLWQFYDRDKISEIIGAPVTENMWIDLPDDIKERKRIMNSEIQFRIDAGSTAPPKDETVDRKQYLDAVSIAGSIAPERLRKDETLKSIFKTFKHVKDVEKIVYSNDEDEAKTAEEENQYMLQGMSQAVSPNENHDIHIKIHSQVVDNELVDTHIVKHGNFLGLISQQGKGASPQEGDLRPPKKSLTPEIERQGIIDEGDIYQSAENLGVGTGSEAI